MEFNTESYRSWMDQAKMTLESSGIDASSGHHNWACFKAQQAVEFGLKSVFYGLGLPAFGHSVVKLAESVTNSIPDLEFDNECLVALDKLYIPTRYADAFAAGSPHTFYASRDSQYAMQCARNIIGAIEMWVSAVGGDQ
jgi:HEPN domain-containing protein